MAISPGPAGLKFWRAPGLSADNTADINNLPAGIGNQFNPWGSRRPVQDWIRGVSPSLLTVAVPPDNDNLPAGIADSFYPWGRKRPVQDWVRGSIPAVPVTFTADSGSYALTGTAAAVAFGHVAGSSSYSITGSAAALALGHVAGAGSYSLTGTAAGLTVAVNYAAAASSYTLTGSAATFAFGHVAGAGSYTLTGSTADLVIPGVVTYLPAGLTGGYVPWGRPHPIVLRTSAGRAPPAAAPFTLTADAGSYGLTGATAALTVSGVTVNMPAGMTGGYVPWGRPPRQDWFHSVAYTTTGAVTLSAGAGSYTLNGSAAALTATDIRYLFRQPLITRIWARSRFVAVSSQNWVARSARLGDVRLPVDAGSYTLTGSTAGWALRLTASAGSYTLTGSAAAPASGFPAAAGAYVLTGSDAVFVGGGTGIAFSAATGSYAITGSAAVLATAFPFSAASGSYVLTGTAANLATPGFFIAGPGSYALTGADAQLIQAGTIVLPAGAGTYLITGSDADLLISIPPSEVVPPSAGGAGAGFRVGRYKQFKLKKKRKHDQCEELLEYLRSLPPAEAEVAIAELPARYLSLLDGLPLPHALVLPPAIVDDDDDDDACALLLELLLR